MSETGRYDSDPRIVILGMGHILINMSSRMSRFRSKGALDKERRNRKFYCTQFVHNPACHMLMTMLEVVCGDFLQ